MQLVQPLPDREFLGGVTIQRMHGRLWISGADLRLLKDNSGTHDGITWYYYNRNQIIETHDGNGKLINQVYHAERARGGSVKEYIDEIVAMRTECGRVYVHQAEGDQCGSLKDWNVIGLSDVTGRVLERYY